MNAKSLCKAAPVAIALLLVPTVATGPFAQTPPAPGAARQAGAPLKGVDVKLTDARGQPVRPESLPPEAQAQLERVRRAAESIMGPPGSTERAKGITVSCTWPPLNCTITISF